MDLNIPDIFAQVASFDVRRYYGCNDAMDSVLVIDLQLVPRDRLYLP